jgi:hypothetical protein
MSQIVAHHSESRPMLSPTHVRAVVFADVMTTSKCRTYFPHLPIQFDESSAHPHRQQASLQSGFTLKFP